MKKGFLLIGSQVKANPMSSDWLPEIRRKGKINGQDGFILPVRDHPLGP